MNILYKYLLSFLILGGFFSVASANNMMKNSHAKIAFVDQCIVKAYSPDGPNLKKVMNRCFDKNIIVWDEGVKKGNFKSFTSSLQGIRKQMQRISFTFLRSVVDGNKIAIFYQITAHDHKHNAYIVNEMKLFTLNSKGKISEIIGLEDWLVNYR